MTTQRDVQFRFEGISRKFGLCMCAYPKDNGSRACLNCDGQIVREAPDEFARLRKLQHLARAVNDDLRAEGARLHDERKHSYAEIGRALGVSRQAAWERFSKR